MLRYPKLHQWRSLLFVRADAERHTASAHRRGADAVILDLEDGVAPDRRSVARAALGKSVDRLQSNGIGCVVRVNASWQDIVADLDVAVRPGVDALMVPKAERTGALETIAEMLAELETQRGLPHGVVALVPLIESALGLTRLAALSSVDRVAGLALGSEDLALSMGVRPERALLWPACVSIAVSAAANGLAAFGLPVSLSRYDDATELKAAACEAFSIGLTGALCIHPAQVPIINTAFAPSVDACLDATRIIERWESPERGGEAVIALAGRMIDKPVVEHARRVLARMGAPS